MPFVSLTLLLFFVFRSEIATLTEKVRALEIAQVNQRKQQAIIMAALAAEKLKKQKNNEFQSDSNLTYYSGNQGLLDPNAGDQPNNLLNHGGAFLQNCFEIVYLVKVIFCWLATSQFCFDILILEMKALPI